MVSKISVIIPLYNKEQYCAEAIQSVLTQSYTEFELIIINDGSTDNSENIAQFAIKEEPRARLINQSNKGVSAARNMGAKIASYDYLAFLDADDLWHPLYLENMVRAISLYPLQQWFGTSFKKFTGDLDVLPLDVVPAFKKLNYFLGTFHDSTRKVDAVSLVSSDSFIVTKNIFNAVGGYPVGLSYSEDVFLYHKIALVTDIIWSPAELTFYRRGVKNQAVSSLVDKPLASFIVDYLSSSREDKKKHEFDFMVYQAKKWAHDKIMSAEYHSKLRTLPLKYMLLSLRSRHFRIQILVKYLPAAIFFRYNAKLAKLYMYLTSVQKWKNSVKFISKIYKKDKI